MRGGAVGYEHVPPRHYHFHVPANPALLRIEPGRLARARKLWCIPLGNRQYVVQGSNEPQWIDMYGDEVCYCEDALKSGRPWVCKHVLRALIEEQHPKVMAFIGDEDAMEAQRNRWAMGEEQ